MAPLLRETYGSCRSSPPFCQAKRSYPIIMSHGKRCPVWDCMDILRATSCRCSPSPDVFPHRLMLAEVLTPWCPPCRSRLSHRHLPLSLTFIRASDTVVAARLSRHAVTAFISHTRWMRRLKFAGSPSPFAETDSLEYRKPRTRLDVHDLKQCRSLTSIRPVLPRRIGASRTVVN